LVLFCGNEEDELLIKAALGTLAILSSLHVDFDSVEQSELEENERQRLKDMINHQRIICEKMLNVSRINNDDDEKNQTCRSFSRFNRFLKSSNDCALVKIQIFNFALCTSFEISSK
jgi:hypothetical protein